MSERWQIRRGTTQENNDFTGAQGELTMDTQKKGLRVHDGTTQGGIEVPTAGTADYVVEWQAPNPNDGYKWYRKYKSGWVEQGGFATAGQYNNGTVINLPVTMANTNYTVLVAPKSNTHWSDDAMYNRNGTSQIIIYAGYNGGSGQNGEVCWEVKGMAA